MIAAWGLAAAVPAVAQQAPSPDVAPAPVVAQPAPTVDAAATAPTEPAKVETASPTPAPTEKPAASTAPVSTPAKITAPRVYSKGNLIVAEGSTEFPVLLESTAGNIRAQRVEVDTEAQTIKATGRLTWERDTLIQRREMRSRNLRRRYHNETFRESIGADDLEYNYRASTGQLENAEVAMSMFTIKATSVEINGKKYTAKNVVLIPGGLTAEERKIYGTPPFSLRAKEITAKQGDGETSDTISAKNAALYFGKTRILPVPGFVTSSLRVGGGKKDPTDPSIMPMVGYNSGDGLLLTTKFRFPLSKDGKKYAALADVGLSQRIGFRGGVSVETQSNLGWLSLSMRQSDVVFTQLTNRIELDRQPELLYRSPDLATFKLPYGRRGGFRLSAGYGDYAERLIDGSGAKVTSQRLATGVTFTTRIRATDGPYVELFANHNDYSRFATSYSNMGYEIGYEGNLLPRVRGQVAYRHNSLDGDTPFRFDRIEIAQELRSTFDIMVTKRYLIPIDLRYDLNENTFRDKTFGVLRSYKNFAYGIVYQQARHDLRLEVRQGF